MTFKAEGDSPAAEKTGQVDQGTDIDTGNPSTDSSGNSGQNVDPIFAKRLADKDSYINQLKEELSSIKQEVESVRQGLQTAKGAQDVMAQLDNSSTTSTGPVPTALDLDQIVQKATEKLEQSMSAKNAEKEKESNWKTVTTTLTDRYGEKVDSVVSKVAAENGMTLEKAEELAKTVPQAFLKLFNSTTNDAPGTNVHTNASSSQSYGSDLTSNELAKIQSRLSELQSAKRGMSDEALELQFRMYQLKGSTKN